MDKVLTQLVEKLQKAYGDRLVSVVLYGSAAAGDHHPGFSDYNLLCVLSEITSRPLGAGGDVRSRLMATVWSPWSSTARPRPATTTPVSPITTCCACSVKSLPASSAPAKTSSAGGANKAALRRCC